MTWLNRWTAGLALVCALGLSACGGGGGSSGDGLYGSSSGSTGTGTGTGSTTSPVASDLLLTLPQASIQNSVTNTVTVTVTAVDGNRNALAAIPVSLSVDNGATITPSGTVTGTGGTVTGVIRIGSDQTARTVTVRATSGTVTRLTTLQVVGARLTASGYSSTVSTSSTGNRITYLLADNTGGKMANYPISITLAGSTVATGSTNADGEFSFSYTAPATAGALTVVATAGGTSDTQTITVSGSSTPPDAAVAVNSSSVAASPNVVSVNEVGSTTNKVEIRALFLGSNNAPVKNVRVWFDLDGDANSIGGKLGSVAYDQNGVRLPVAQQSLLYSDANGIARTTYAPGTRSSPKDGVSIRACWGAQDFTIPAEGATCANVTRTSLTVISESLSVSIGTDGLLSTGASGVTYVQRFAVQVVDASGQAKVGVQVSPSLDLLSYYKGEWRAPNGVTKWKLGGLGAIYSSNVGTTGVTVPTSNARSTWTSNDDPSGAGPFITTCDNEDLNRNGVVEDFLDVVSNTIINEDQNGSRNLTPQRPALDPRKADVTVAVVGSSTTDSNGIVVLKIEYPMNVAGWVHYNLLVSAAGVAGTEGRANYEADLGVLASAVNNVNADPPFRVSPYGVQGSTLIYRKNAQGQSGWLCTNPN